jgi:hypothetical protein
MSGRDSAGTTANAHAALVNRALRGDTDALYQLLRVEARNIDWPRVEPLVQRVADASVDVCSQDAPLPCAVRALDAPVPEPLQFHVQPIVIANEYHLFVGAGGEGKTTLLLGLAGAVAGGYRAYDAFDTVPAPVYIVSEEDAAAIVLNRLEAMCEGHGWDRDRVLGNVHVLAQAGASLNNARWQDHLIAEVRRTGAKLCILDNLAELTTGQENVNDDAKAVNRFIRRLMAATAAAVAVIHHAGKPAEGKRKIDRVRGASAYVAAARAVYWLERHAEGVAVETLKYNRGRPPAPFVVSLDVEESAPGTWLSAQLCYINPRVADDSRAEAFVLEQLDAGRMNTSMLKRAAKGTGISALDVSGAISRLEKLGRIEHVPGPKNAKMWTAVCLPNDSRQPRQPDLPACPQLAGQPGETPVVVARPLYEGNHGQGAGNRSATSSEQPIADSPERHTHACTSCGKYAFPEPGRMCMWCRKTQEAAA